MTAAGNAAARGDDWRDGRRPTRPHVCHRGAPDGLSRSHLFAGEERPGRAALPIVRRWRATMTKRPCATSPARSTCSPSSLKISPPPTIEWARASNSSGRPRRASCSSRKIVCGKKSSWPSAGFPVAPFRRGHECGRPHERAGSDRPSRDSEGRGLWLRRERPAADRPGDGPRRGSGPRARTQSACWSG